jgi:acyl-CoA synthetase (AMP-forming)/AMP-acid ligase II
MGQPVVSWIEHHARRTPDRVALVDLHRARQLTYRELAAPVRALAERHGVRAGERELTDISREVARFPRAPVLSGPPVDAAVPAGLRENAAHA